MTQVTTGRIRRYVSIGMTVALLSSLVVWFFGRDTIPREILIATGSKTGLYFKLGSELRKPLKRRLPILRHLQLTMLRFIVGHAQLRESFRVLLSNLA